LSRSSPQAADVRHAFGQGAFDDELPNPNDGDGAFTSPVREVWQSINEWQSDRAIRQLME
jgi:hypothetical protein